MDNQTPPLTNPPLENPVQPAVSTQSTTTPPSPKSFLSNQLILIVIILIILLGASGTYLALNSKPKPAPTISKVPPTSTPTQISGPTASWKTYTNSNAGYSFKYPNDYQIMENQKKSVDGVTVSTPNTTTILSPVLSGLNTNMQIGIHYENGAVNLSEIEVAKKLELNINGSPYTINGKGGFIFVDTPLGPYGSTIIYITANNKSYTFTIESQTSYAQYKQYLDQILSTFKFTQ